MKPHYAVATHHWRKRSCNKMSYSTFFYRTKLIIKITHIFLSNITQCFTDQFNLSSQFSYLWIPIMHAQFCSIAKKIKKSCFQLVLFQLLMITDKSWCLEVHRSFLLGLHGKRRNVTEDSISMCYKPWWKFPKIAVILFYYGHVYLRLFCASCYDKRPLKFVWLRGW